MGHQMLRQMKMCVVLMVMVLTYIQKKSGGQVEQDKKLNKHYYEEDKISI